MQYEVWISKNAYQKLVEHAKVSYPEEACGVLLSTGGEDRIDDVICVDNSADEEQRGSRFGIDPVRMYEIELEAERNGARLSGVYHSHPDKPAVLSGEDEKYMIPGVPYIVASVTKRECTDIQGYIRERADGECVSMMIHLTKADVSRSEKSKTITKE